MPNKNWKFFERVNIYRSGDNSLNAQLYMIRWIILRTPWFSIMVHKFLLSDDDCLHDHPWPFISFIFWGSYYEWCCYDDLPLNARIKHLKNSKSFVTNEDKKVFGEELHIRRKFKAPALLYRKAKWRHRVEIDKPCWTIVVTTRNVRKWGFWTREGWIHHTKYNSMFKCD